MRELTTGASSPQHSFTIDLEEWFHGIELSEDRWPDKSRLTTGLSRLLALLDRYSVTATFFVLGVVAERFPSLVRELFSMGHEIACHGNMHRLVYRQSPEDFRQDICQARERIGEAIGGRPVGYRAPYFSIRRDSLWALDVLADEGFVYDSSIFPIKNYRYGIPDAPRVPYDINTSSGVIREIPLTPARVIGNNIPYSGGAYLRLLPWTTQRVFWEMAERRGEHVIAYIHPWELDPDHPRIELPRRIALTHYTRLHLTERRLNRLLRSYRFGRLDAVYGLA